MRSHHTQVISFIDYNEFTEALEGRTWSNPTTPAFEMCVALEFVEGISDAAMKKTWITCIK